MAPCVTAAGEAPDGVSTIVFTASICCVAFIICLKEQQGIDLVSQSLCRIATTYVGIWTSTNGQPVHGFNLLAGLGTIHIHLVHVISFPDWIVIQLVTSLIGFGHVNHHKKIFRLEVYYNGPVSLTWEQILAAKLLPYTSYAKKTWSS